MSVVSLEALQVERNTWQRDRKCLVVTNGVFDLLHYGHVAYLEQARALGDVLVVGVNSDESTRTIKGPQRPLISEDERAYLLAALRCVDYVTIFPQPTAETLVQVLQPEIYVKGGDYASATPPFDDNRLPEARIVRSYGGQVTLLPYRQGHSTTELIARIVERCAKT